MNHETLRHLADTWGLLFLILVFVILVWASLRPSQRAARDRAKMIPLNDGD